MAANVFVRGFDYGTTVQQIKAHCSTAGTVVSLEKWGDGAAVVTYDSPESAQAAVDALNQTTIEGNSRFIDVKIDLKSLPEKAGKGGKAVKASFTRVKREAPGSGSNRVYIRGFDFGTTDEQFEQHCSAVGQVQKVQWCTKGSAVVTFSTKEEAEAAARDLNQTIIDGNSRYIDVILKDDEDSGMPFKKARVTPMKVNVPAKGQSKGGTWVFMPNASPARPAKAKGKGKGREDPPGSGRVFVRGFDFETTDEQLIGHMSLCGAVETVHWVSKGSAVVVYKTRKSAQRAAGELNQSIIADNRRYIDVVLKDSE
eukprot:TRINITY_DN48155_c0_g1_i1.p1 TRINITY_DN48155_c0_g1~~TRINITY_DN48155_c0_g1_i1.p1  ORF type:complete len:312 (+),score=73.43 TRINITY_DN48155_c0_g1_i1:84-1019(+)